MRSNRDAGLRHHPDPRCVHAWDAVMHADRPSGDDANQSGGLTSAVSERPIEKLSSHQGQCSAPSTPTAVSTTVNKTSLLAQTETKSVGRGRGCFHAPAATGEN